MFTRVPRTELFVDIYSICGLKEKSHTNSAQITKESYLVAKRNVATQDFSVLFDCDVDTAEHCLVSDQRVLGGIPPLSAPCCLFVPAHSHSSPRSVAAVMRVRSSHDNLMSNS